MEACSAPAEQRCLGWDVERQAVLCGPGYRQGSIGCSGCASGYYPSSDGTCAQCPSRDVFSSLVLPLLYLAGGAVGLVGVLTGLAYAVSAGTGGTLAGSFQRSAVLLLWVWSTLQLLAQGVRGSLAVVGAAPSWLQPLFYTLLILQFEGITVHPACFTLFPFQMQFTFFALAALALLVLLAFTWVTSQRAGSAEEAAEERAEAEACEAAQVAGLPLPPPSTPPTLLHRAASLALWLLLFLYPMVTNASLQVLMCSNTPTTVAGYMALVSDGTHLRTAPELRSSYATELSTPGFGGALQGYLSGTSPLSALPPTLQPRVKDFLATPLVVPTLTSDPFFVCFEGAHTAAYTMGWTMLLCVSLAFPLAALLSVAFGIHRRMGLLPATAGWQGVSAHWPPLPFWCCKRGAGATPATDASVKPPSAAAAEAARHIDASLPLLSTPLLARFVAGDRRPSCFYFTTLDQALLLLLAIPAAYNATVDAVANPKKALLLQGLAMGGIVAATVGMARLSILVQPFALKDQWRHRVVLGVLGLTGLLAVLNFLSWSSTTTDGSTPGGLRLRQAGLAVLLAFTVLAFALIVYLLYNFFASLREAAKQEGRERREATEAAATAEALCDSAGSQVEQQQQELQWQRNPFLSATSAYPSAIPTSASAGGQRGRGRWLLPHMWVAKYPLSGSSPPQSLERVTHQVSSEQVVAVRNPLPSTNDCKHPKKRIYYL